MCEAMRQSVQTAHAVQHCVQLYCVQCTVVQSFSSQQEMDSHMFHMLTSWSEDLVSCQFLADLRTSNLLNICKQK